MAIQYIGASPDSIISCGYHGVGILEIKSPCIANVEQIDIQSASVDRSFCLKRLMRSYFYTIAMPIIIKYSASSMIVTFMLSFVHANLQWVKTKSQTCNFQGYQHLR